MIEKWLLLDVEELVYVDWWFDRMRLGASQVWVRWL